MFLYSFMWARLSEVSGGGRYKWMWGLAALPAWPWEWGAHSGHFFPARSPRGDEGRSWTPPHMRADLTFRLPHSSFLSHISCEAGHTPPPPTHYISRVHLPFYFSYKFREGMDRAWQKVSIINYSTVMINISKITSKILVLIFFLATQYHIRY